MVKLKRFLLRYDPPGIGFEYLQEDGTETVCHKDLPSASQITGVQDIEYTVDQLIKEDAMLTPKRHRSALIQLCKRLYQIDTGNEPDETTLSPNKTDKSPEHKLSYEAEDSKNIALQSGRSVVLTGLSGDLAVHNGEIGVLGKCKPEKGTYYVQLTESHKEVKIKGSEHIVLEASSAKAPAAGDFIAIRGLRNHTELNGSLGRVVECHPETGRYEVRTLDSGQLFRVKRENFVLIMQPGSENSHELNAAVSPRTKVPAVGGAASAETAAQDDGIMPGATVELTGLKTAMAYNGSSAEVLSVDRARARYEIKLEDGSVKTIRAENVRLVAAAKPQVSPRSGRRKEGKAGK
uniref:Uncharacterized protein n=1 Tax=Zooxanthella nutricula TaxID=1333877 RepID=A0A6V0E9A6_9DINO|mmetsp:Transcript_96963/g.296365  ORF Transcript_96963/g.296365 Transcript_96963/m.296365 type:complete len:349 (+) Transcript_96963:100-1146(+)